MQFLFQMFICGVPLQLSTVSNGWAKIHKQLALAPGTHLWSKLAILSFNSRRGYIFCVSFLTSIPTFYGAVDPIYAHPLSDTSSPLTMSVGWLNMVLKTFLKLLKNGEGGGRKLMKIYEKSKNVTCSGEGGL